MSRIKSFLFGGAEFSEDEAYRRFQFRMLYALVWLGPIFSGLFILAYWFGFSHVPELHVRNCIIYFFSCLVLLWRLYGHKERYLVIAWLAEILTMSIYISSLMLVQDDAMRIIWFYINLPAAYIMLGGAAGIGATLVSFALIFVANDYVSVPYNTNELTTFVLTFTYASVFLYVYSTRSYSFSRGMEEAVRQLRELAAVDPLTGLRNARAYYAECDRFISIAKRANQPYSVLFVDLDHFKRINDTYGHAAGDTVLREVAACLARTVRKSDMVGRIGGEEFSLFLPDTELQGALELAEKLRAEISALHPSIGDTRLTITASIGVAQNLQQHRAIEDIQREADQAMYQAKREGRNRVTCLQPAAA